MKDKPVYGLPSVFSQISKPADFYQLPGIMYEGFSRNANGTLNTQVLQQPLKIVFNNSSVAGVTKTYDKNAYAYKIIVYTDGSTEAVGIRNWITHNNNNYDLSNYSTEQTQIYDFLQPALFLGKSFTIDMTSYPTEGTITYMIYYWLE